MTSIDEAEAYFERKSSFMCCEERLAWECIRAALAELATAQNKPSAPYSCCPHCDSEASTSVVARVCDKCESIWVRRTSA